MGSVFLRVFNRPSQLHRKFQNLLWRGVHPEQAPSSVGGPLGPFLLTPPSPAQPLLLSGLGQPLHCLMEWPGLGHSTSLCLSFPSLESPRAWKNGR